MKKLFFLAGLLALLSTDIWAQKKISNDIFITKELAYIWPQSVASIITFNDAKHKEVKKISNYIQPNKAVKIDISSLNPGPYTVSIRPENMQDTLPGITININKKQSNNFLFLTLSTCNDTFSHPRRMKKPVIYLYPQQAEDITVKVDFKGELTATIPAYNGGWKVKVTPESKITNYADGKLYPYLFWEGDTYKQDWEMSEGFVVSRDKTKQFLQKQLQAMGLMAKEYNEFIDFWLPLLQQNEYNLIHFAGREYEDLAPLTITPKPDATLRVFMVFKATDKNTLITPQYFKEFVRKGFTVVEWGGMQLDLSGDNSKAAVSTP